MAGGGAWGGVGDSSIFGKMKGWGACRLGRWCLVVGVGFGYLGPERRVGAGEWLAVGERVV